MFIVCRVADDTPSTLCWYKNHMSCKNLPVASLIFGLFNEITVHCEKTVLEILPTCEKKSLTNKEQCGTKF